GYMKFDQWAVKFIDTPHIQRLRGIKQLGTTFYVFPGATHSRFEHSLGTAHLAYTLTKKLQFQVCENYSEYDLRNLKCVTLAALCHDLGHGPYSYLFNRDFIRNRLEVEDWDLKVRSVMMFEDIIKNYVKLDSIGLKEEDGEFIKELIKDVDKFDYLARDCYYSGVELSYKFSRLMESSRVSSDKEQIIYSHKDCYNIYQMFHTRYSLHKVVYKHKVGRAIDHMICDALEKADQHFNFKSAIRDPKKYMRLSDSIFYEIEYLGGLKNALLNHEIINTIEELTEQNKHRGYTLINALLKVISRFADGTLSDRQILDDSQVPNNSQVLDDNQEAPSNDDNLKKSRDILNRIKRRDLYKFVTEYKISFEEKTFEQKTNNYRDGITNEKIANKNPGELDKHDIIVDWLTLDYGKESDNPVDDVKFYDKYYEVKTIYSYQVSSLLPLEYCEKIVRIYTRKNDKIELIKNAFHKLRDELKPTEEQLKKMDIN
ncbi:8668_t:CDS:2, partial [Dentiscutata erythropus]